MIPRRSFLAALGLAPLLKMPVRAVTVASAKALPPCVPVITEFTDRARRAMQLANQEAQRWNHPHVGAEHVLLGIVKDGANIASNALKNLDVDLRKLRLEIEKYVPMDNPMITMGKLPLTEQCKSLISFSGWAAVQLGSEYIGCEHLLLAILREKPSVALTALHNLGVTYSPALAEVKSIVSAWKRQGCYHAIEQVDRESCVISAPMSFKCEWQPTKACQVVTYEDCVNDGESGVTWIFKRLGECNGNPRPTD